MRFKRELEDALRHDAKTNRKKPNISIVPSLLVDLAGVCCLGLRAATLLNVLPPTITLGSRTVDTLRTIIDDMVRKHRRTSSHAIRILIADGCLLVLDTALLVSRTFMPRGIRFIDNDVRWMDGVEQASLETQLKALAVRLHDGTHPCLEDYMRDANVSVSMPTIYGFILGYPCTYEVLSRDHGAVVSRWLSSATLVFYYYRTRALSQVLDGLGGGDDGAVLLSFSVPKQLVENSSATMDWSWQLRAWQEEMLASAAASSIGVDGRDVLAKPVLSTEVASYRGIAI